APEYRDEPSYREPSYPASSHHVSEEEDVWSRREGSGARERPSPPPARSYAAPVPSYDDASDSAQWGRDRMQPPSTRQENPRHQQAQAHQAGWSSMPPQADDSRVDEPMIPPAPRVPEEMHPAFVVGVQRIRTATPDAWGTPHVAAPQLGQYLPSPMQAIQASMPPQYAQNQPYAYQHAYVQQQQQLYAQQQRAPQYQHQPTAYAASPQQYLQPGQRQPTPMPMHPSSMSPMAPASMRVQPIGNQLTQPEAPNAKIGRFAWFVAGAAFGITFAFFATGFFNGGKLTKDDAAVAPVATVTAPVATVTAPVVAPVAPAAPAFAAAAPMAPFAQPGQPGQPGFAPAFAPGAPFGQFAAAPVAPAAPAAQPAAPPVARVAPPAQRAPRFQAPPPRRPSAPASQAPKNLGGGGAGGDDEAPAPRAPAAPPGGDLGDLLGAGLKP
ncbi:MAG: Extensin-like protein precursor, partial [Myxococcaceae bacterium]|nr:Extensin-like protein precursor [Myxococcaceae bacterium]